MTLKILLIGDIHLGKKPTKLSDKLLNQIHEFTPTQGLIQSVDFAIEQKVDVVAMLGDVVEKENDFFESFRLLSAQVQRLLHQNIKVIAVAGNHDVKILPKLADLIPEFKLLGRGGEWEIFKFEKQSQIVQFCGWSFPQAHVKESPFKKFNLSLEKTSLSFGLLHGDLDVPNSHYAPFTTREILNCGFDACFLGHVHKPSKLDEKNLIGYLGSLTASDPGETSQHGPWLLKIEHQVISSLMQIPLANLRWEILEIDVTGKQDRLSIKEDILRKIMEYDQSLSDHFYPKVVGLRLRFVGRSSMASDLMSIVTEEDKQQIFYSQRGTHYFVEKVLIQTLPEIDLLELSKDRSPIGILSQQIIALKNDLSSPLRDEIVRNYRIYIDKVGGSKWSQYRELLDDDEKLVEHLLRSGMQLLESLQQQGNK